MTKAKSTTELTITIEVGCTQVYASIYIGSEKVGRLWAQLQPGVEQQYPGIHGMLQDRLRRLGVGR